jgi:methanogenic corrinoid protein MtbC1
VIILKEGLRFYSSLAVGGAPVNTDYTNKTGADGYCEGAAKPVEGTKDLIS